MVSNDRASALVDHLSQMTIGSFLFCSLALLVIYLLTLAVYRLILHPLAKFPGPKFAAVSYWYEYYFDVKQKGRYMWKIIDLHAKYGPVVRINPNEVHINDPEVFGEIYHLKAIKTDRDRWYTLEFLGDGAAFTIDHDRHKIRRHAIESYFSKQSIKTLEPRVTSVVEHMLQRLQEAYRAGTVVNLRYLFTAFALDIVSEYTLGKSGSTALMGKPEFGRAWTEMADSQVAMNNSTRHFPLFFKLMVALPTWVVIKLSPGITENLIWREDLLKQVDHVLRDVDMKTNTKETNIIRDLATGDLPSSDKERVRLRDESSLLIGAGGETTAQTLARTCYYLLNNPAILQSLQKELKTSMPDPSGSIPSLVTLQKLPYLTAVVEEGVRIAFPVTTRSPRVFQSHTLQYRGWAIPPGAAISQSPYIVSSNPEIFPDPFTFKPERWLNNKTSGKWQVAFSKGRRSCVGINLAYAELYFAIATIFRKFKLELYETTHRDVDVIHDCFIGMASAESKGVRVRVVGELP